MKELNSETKGLGDNHKAALKRIDNLASIKDIPYRTFIAYRTNRKIDEWPVVEVKAHSLDEAVVSLKEKQKEAGVSTMWTVYEGKADWMSIRGIVMTVITCKGTTIQHFMK